MHRRTSDRNQPFAQVFNHIIDAAPWLVPLLLTASGVALLVDVLGGADEWGRVALWLTLCTIALNSHALGRHVIGRLTAIIALWHDDVQIQHRPTRVAEVRNEENVVVPILRTVIARRTGTED